MDRWKPDAGDRVPVPSHRNVGAGHFGGFNGDGAGRIDQWLQRHDEWMRFRHVPDRRRGRVAPGTTRVSGGEDAVQACGLFGCLGADLVSVDPRGSAVAQCRLTGDVDIDRVDRGREREMPWLDG